MPFLPDHSPKRAFSAEQKKPQQGRKYTEKRYNTSRWKKYRTWFLNRYPLCVECEKRGRTVEATVVDHITPVSDGGDFWNTDNHQSLCDHHHNRKSGKEAHR